MAKYVAPFFKMREKPDRRAFHYFMYVIQPTYTDKLLLKHMLQEGERYSALPIFVRIYHFFSFNCSDIATCNSQNVYIFRRRILLASYQYVSPFCTPYEYRITVTLKLIQYSLV